MSKYRAIVSIEFDDEDIAEFAKHHRVKPENVDVIDLVNGDLDNLSVGCGWVEQMFHDGVPTIGRMSGGIMVQINEHDL